MSALEDLGVSAEEAAKMESAFASHLKNTQAKFVLGEKGQTRTLSTDLERHHTLYFKNLEDGDYVVSAPCTKILIESCRNTRIKLEAQIMTQTIEVWKCDNVNFEINAVLQTVQADLCNGLTLNYRRRELFGQVVWAGIENLRIEVEQQVLETGYTAMKVEYPDLSSTTDQFIVRNIKNKIIQELVVRLKNGYPTTEREADEFDEKQRKNDEAYANYVRSIVKVTEKKHKLDTKTGRNEACPCGSGKKYKKCHGVPGAAPLPGVQGEAPSAADDNDADDDANAQPAPAPAPASSEQTTPASSEQTAPAPAASS